MCMWLSHAPGGILLRFELVAFSVLILRDGTLGDNKRRNCWGRLQLFNMALEIDLDANEYVLELKHLRDASWVASWVATLIAEIC